MHRPDSASLIFNSFVYFVLSSYFSCFMYFTLLYFHLVVYVGSVCLTCAFGVVGDHGAAGDVMDDSVLDQGLDTTPQSRRSRREACTCPYCKDGDGR